MMAIRKQENEIYNKNGYVVLDKFIEYETSLILFHHVMMSARRAKYAQVNEPDLYDDEKQHYGHFDNAGGCLNKLVWNKYADGVIETVLSLATPMIEEIVGKKLMPTYSWARLYEHETSMHKHVDKSECDVSATLTLGYELHNMEDKDKESYCWPIFFGDVSGRKGTEGKPIQLLPGQMCVYQGTKIEHWREPFRGVHHAQVFLHWVERKEENEHLYIDSRPMLGLNSDFVK